MHIVIAGNGVSAITFLKEIKRESKNVEIDVFSEEARPFYWRPRLIEVMANEASIEEITPYDEKWYEEHNAKLHLSESIVEIDTKNKKAKTSKGNIVEYDAFIFANGAKPFLLPVPGNDLKNVYTIRTYEDVEKIKSHYGKSNKFVIIGGGVLGIETAAALNRAGEKEVSIVEFFPYLLPRQLDKPGAFVLKEVLERKYPLKFLLGKATSRIVGSDKVKGVEFSDKTSVKADVVIFSTGVRPNVEVAKKAGIKVEKGIVVDDTLKTNVDDVYAIGDVAQHKGRVYGIVPPAVEQARTLAKILFSDEKVKYEGSIMANTLKVAGVDLLSVGKIDPDSGNVIFSSQGDTNKGLYKKVVVEDGSFVGVVSVGIDKKSAFKLKKLVDEKKEPTSSIFQYVKFDDEEE
ncbi:NAD(P)/FAD-dependent oxidoreductase [Mesoaciditoga lauensis]|uniref:NAD(P)/FAD-dependent oxidoreductase n=1 Tax=Mesoaciditoga lauensis TaxID=1495039 RepID=UPI00068DB0C0|nr:FAD-dependent oxidoreductase [Mesoaciditoga lauensis]